MEVSVSVNASSAAIAAVSALSGIGGAVSGVAMAAGMVADAVGDVVSLDPSSLCLCEDVSLQTEDEEEVQGSIRANHKVRVLQEVPVTSGHMYYFSCKTRMLNDPPGEMWATLYVHAIFGNSTGQQRNAMIGKMNHVRQEDGWVDVGGDFTTPHNMEFLDVEVSVSNPETELEVAAQSMSLTRLLSNPLWREQADRRIRYLRRGTITLKVKVSEQYDPSKLEFKLEQKKAGFPFGTAVDANKLGGTSETDHKYREFLFNYFNWATPANDVKWRIMERKQGEPRFHSGDTALEVLHKQGFGVRGHCLLWTRTKKIPPWLKDEDAQTVQDNVDRRLTYCAQHWGDKFSHWDVNNEQLHEAWYAEKLGQPDFMSTAFKTFNKMAPNVSLFTNDFYVFAGGLFTQAYKQQVKRLLKNQAPVGGVGLQAHFSGTSDLTFLMKRLEILSEPGVPLWLTEFDVGVQDAETRAQLYEDVMRLCYSHPNVYGIVMWGFWDGAMHKPHPAIVEGPDFKLNESGKRLVRLWREEWWTNETLTIPEEVEGEEEVTLSTQAFHGTHTLTVIYDGSSLVNKELILEPGHTLVVHVEI